MERKRLRCFVFLKKHFSFMLKLIVAYCHNITALYSFLCDYFQCYFSFIDLNSLLLLFAARYLLKKNSVVIVLN